MIDSRCKEKEDSRLAQWNKAGGAAAFKASAKRFENDDDIKAAYEKLAKLMG